MVDLERGRLVISPFVKSVVDNIKAKRSSIKLFVYAMVILNVGISIKLAINNIDSVVSVGSGVDLSEKRYEMLHIDISTDFVSKPKGVVSNMDISTSLINRKMQRLNIKDISEAIKVHLQTNDYICIHAKHFGINDDIIVFNNMTLINPAVLETSVDTFNVPEIGVNDAIVWAKRPLRTKLGFVNETTLDIGFVDVYGPISACFWHYYT